jgi:AcrR family transcriptional regulator
MKLGKSISILVPSRYPMVVKQSRREEILEAMLELVVERGFNDAPMSELSKRSGASAGIIYHYFSNKDDIIHQLYLSIKAIKGKSLIENLVADMPTKGAFLQVWKNAYNFYRTHRKEARFLDQYENEPCYTQQDMEASIAEDPNFAFLLKFFRTKKQGGLLRDLPIEVFAELTFGVAARLAKHREALSPEMLAEVAETCWRSVTED